MVNWSLIPSSRSLVGCVVALSFLVLAGCRTVDPVKVEGSFVTAPKFATNCPTVVGVLPIEDGSEGGAAARHLTFLRQELNRQLVDRGYSSTTENWVDAALMGVGESAASVLTPDRLAALAKAGRDDLLQLILDKVGRASFGALPPSPAARPISPPSASTLSSLSSRTVGRRKASSCARS